jgi:hypothetical protein
MSCYIGFGKNKDQLKKERKKKKRLSKEIREEKLVIWNQIHHETKESHRFYETSWKESCVQ